MMLIGSRTRAGLSHDQLAEKSGVSVKEIANIEAGKLHEVSVDLLIDLLDATGTTLVARQNSASGAVPDELNPGEVTAGQVPVELREWLPGQRRLFVVHTPVELAHALMMARLRAGQTQQRAADAMGMQSATVCKHETGMHSVTIDTLARYAQHYGVEFVIGAKRETPA